MDFRNKIIVANTGDDTLSIVDPVYMNQVYKIKLESGTGPYDLISAKEHRYVLVSEFYNDSLACIDLKGENIEKTIVVGCRPSYISLDNDWARAYVSNTDSDSISIICADKLKLAGQISSGSMPQGIDCHPFLSKMAVANTNSNDVWIIETVGYNVERVVKINGYPTQVKFSTDGRLLYVGCSCHEQEKEGKVLAVGLNDYSMCWETTIHGMPGRISETDNGQALLVTSLDMGGIEAINIKNGNTLYRIKTQDMTHGLALDKSQRYAYVTNPNDNSVSVIDVKLAKKVKDIEVGLEPNGIIYIP